MEVAIDKITVGEGRRELRDVDELAKSIKEIGLLNPITITKDYRLVAGYHRLTACKKLGWTTIPANVVDMDKIDAELAEIDENLIRNELTVLERTEHLKRRKELYEMKYPETKQGQAQALGMHQKLGHNVSTPSVPTFVEDTVKKTGRGRQTIYEELQIATRLDDEVKDMIRNTDLADRKKDLLKLARMDKEEQKKVAEKIKSGVAKDIKTAKKVIKQEERTTPPPDLPAVSDRYRILHGDFVQMAKQIEPESVDVIITDPPYPKEYLDLYEDLAIVARDLLKPGGSLVVMVGQSYLPEILEKMTPHIRYHWTLAYLTPGGQSVQLWQRKVNTFWKPLLWFVNGDYTGDWIGDVAKSAVNDNDKRFHHWGQSESGMADIINRFSKPGDTILDPFMGGGTTGVVAVSMNRKFIGIDIDQKAVETSKARIAEVAAYAEGQARADRLA